jgi:hypothetical protein
MFSRASITTVHITLSLLCGVQKRQSPSCEIWEIIATISANPVEVGMFRWWTEGRTIFVADAHRDGNHLIVHADEKLAAFLEPESCFDGSGPNPSQTKIVALGKHFVLELHWCFVGFSARASGHRAS